MHYPLCLEPNPPSETSDMPSDTLQHSDCTVTAGFSGQGHGWRSRAVPREPPSRCHQAESKASFPYSYTPVQWQQNPAMTATISSVLLCYPEETYKHDLTQALLRSFLITPEVIQPSLTRDLDQPCSQLPLFPKQLLFLPTSYDKEDKESAQANKR